MTVVMVNVCIGSGFQPYSHQRFYHIELHFEQTLVVGIFIEHGKPVVATHFQLTLLVGNVELIVGIEHSGVDGITIIIYGVIVETVEPVTFKNIFRGAPIGFAML